MNIPAQFLISNSFSRKVLYEVLITITLALLSPQIVFGESISCKTNYETVPRDYSPLCFHEIALINSFIAENNIIYQKQCWINPRVFIRLLKPLIKASKALWKKAGIFIKNNRGRITKFFKETFSKNGRIAIWFRKNIGSTLESKLLLYRVERVKGFEEAIPTIEKYLSKTEASEESLKLIRDIKSDASKAEEYLANSDNVEGVKVIRCLKTDSEKVKLTLQEGNDTKINKIITNFSGTFNVSHYDIKAMKERFYFVKGIEYVEFIIPKKAQYILNGQYSQRVYECMIFNLPKDANGNWEKVKALINDIFNRPSELWSEVRFRQELKKINVDSRTVNEIEQYMFAQNNKNNIRKERYYDQFVYEEAA